MLYSNLNSRQKKAMNDSKFKQSLANGSQSKLVLGRATAGTGSFNFLTSTAPKAPLIAAPASYNFGSVGKGATVNIGSNVNSQNVASTSETNIGVGGKRSGAFSEGVIDLVSDDESKPASIKKKGKITKALTVCTIEYLYFFATLAFNSSHHSYCY